jgi:8-oxo-dGTP diphosphatase
MNDSPRAHATLRVTVDLVILTVRDGSLQTLLIERDNEPYCGRPALPGGFLRPGENLPAAARRELREETGLDVTGALTLYVHDRFPARLTPGTTIEWHVYCGATVAGQDDVVLGEGDALRFVQPDEAATLPYASRVESVVPKFLASPEYQSLLP